MILQRAIRPFPHLSLHSSSKSEYKRASRRQFLVRYEMMHSWPAAANPTPYQVLGLRRDLPYNKAAFNALVKLYHPDSHASRKESQNDASSAEIRLQRYYLVVAAHELLSCPSKRLLYDRQNIGWKHSVAYSTENTRSRNNSPTYTHSEHESSSKQQKPIYMSNGFFAILVLSVAMANAVIQQERGRRSAARHRRRVLWLHEDIVQSLSGSRQLNEGKSRDKRILEFLCRQYIASNKTDGLFEGEDWENNICRH